MDPAQVGRAYAQALREGRVDDAYALTSTEYRGQVPLEHFRERYADANAREQRAAVVESALSQLRAQGPGIGLVAEASGWRIEDPQPTADDPAVTLRKFLDSADRGDFATAYSMLAAPWRARYTPERLKEDLEREPLGRERIARARHALSTAAVLRGDGAEWPLGEGRAVRLIREDGEFRVVSLE
jgi:hypothetical protein